MRSFALFFVLLFCGLKLFPQVDSTLFSEDQPDGIYPTYNDFRRNNFIGKDQIVTDIDKDQLEFIGKVMNGDKFSYKTGGGISTTECRNTWGFFQNKTLYVNFRGDFYRVPVFGAICYLVANVTVYTSYYNPMFGYGGAPVQTKVITEFLMNFYDGIMTEFKLEKAEELIGRDKTLFEEYKSLRRRQQKDQITRYIRKYNELHPVYFLSGVSH